MAITNPLAQKETALTAPRRMELTGGLDLFALTVKEETSLVVTASSTVSAQGMALRINQAMASTDTKMAPSRNLLSTVPKEVSAHQETESLPRTLKTRKILKSLRSSSHASPKEVGTTTVRTPPMRAVKTLFSLTEEVTD